MAIIHKLPGALVDFRKEFNISVDSVKDIPGAIKHSDVRIHELKKDLKAKLEDRREQRHTDIAQLRADIRSEKTVLNHKLDNKKATLSQRNLSNMYERFLAFIHFYSFIFWQKIAFGSFLAIKWVKISFCKIKFNWDCYKYKKQYDSDHQKLLYAKQRLEDSIGTAKFKGAMGEELVLDALSNLSDEYNIYCDVKIQLNRYIRFGNRSKLGSAQIDFVVTSSKGIFVLEVKNYSDFYANVHKRFTSHEQAAREARVLNYFIYSTMNKSVDVKPFVVSIQNNIMWNPDFPYVYCTCPEKLLLSLSEREYEVNSIVLEEINQYLENQV